MNEFKRVYLDHISNSELKFYIRDGEPDISVFSLSTGYSVYDHRSRIGFIVPDILIDFVKKK